MLKLKNSEAAALLSPAAQKMFAEKDFPISAGFKILSIVKALGPSVEAYRLKYRQIIDAHGGKLSASGAVSFADPGDEALAAAEINELDAVELEYLGDKLTPNDAWPKLTIRETEILSPLIG